MALGLLLKRRAFADRRRRERRNHTAFAISCGIVDIGSHLNFKLGTFVAPALPFENKAQRLSIAIQRRCFDPNLGRAFIKIAIMFAKVEPMKLSKEIKVDAAAMSRLEGRYQLAPTFIFDVNVVHGRLMVGITISRISQLKKCSRKASRDGFTKLWRQS